MATGTQMQTAWDLWIRDFAEMLEIHFAEVKHKGELKLRHPEPLAHRRLLHAMIHWKSRRATTPMPLPSSKPQSLHPVACQATALPGFCPMGPSGCPQPTGPPASQTSTPQARQHTSHRPPQEISNTTRCQLQNCLGDIDKQDWMLKE
jgi:hypothetical protein